MSLGQKQLFGSGLLAIKTHDLAVYQCSLTLYSVASLNPWPVKICRHGNKGLVDI